ncbi:MAG: PIN domain-containing protein, partial [Nonlabens sp.]|uniref:PIN domain-containing protein n=1 Tax=Nonlabens sp. TaxID=1888209 RepID=UPI003EF66FB7
PTVIQEVDSKKKDGRLGQRAREFNRLISAFATSDVETISIISEEPNVEIGIATCNPIDWEKYVELDRYDNDQKIIAEILNTKNLQHSKKIVVSQDINPILIAKRNNIKTKHVPDSWLPATDNSPNQRENERLKREIADFKKTEPEFEIIIQTKHENTELYKVKKLSEEEKEELINSILISNPKPTQQKNVYFQMLYDSTLDDRYLKYKNKTLPDYIKNYHSKIEQHFNQIPFSISIKNLGKIRAEHAKVEVDIVGGKFNRKPIFSAFYPSAPVVENPLLYEPPIFNHRFERDEKINRHEFKVEDSDISNNFTAECEDFRHEQVWEYKCTIILDPYLDKEFVIIAKVTAANFHGKKEAISKFKCNVNECHFSDLVDPINKKYLKAYYFEELVNEMKEKHNFDLIEFDSKPR